MCGRYAASRRPEDLVVEFEAVAAEGQAPLPADYNVAPTKDVYVVRHKKERDAEGALTGGGHRELRAGAGVSCPPGRRTSRSATGCSTRGSSR